MKTLRFPSVLPVRVLALGLLWPAGLPGLAAAEADPFPNRDSYVKLTGQAAAISGSDTAFQSRTRQPANGGAGIEDLRISKEVSRRTSLLIEGRALVGAEDYLGSFKLTTNEVGTLEAGFKRFRTFYDGVGGFFPANGQWLPLADQDLHVDRAKFWIEGILARPGTPEVTVRYTNELRTGRKDSTIMGSTDLTGLPFNLAPNPVSPARKIVPSFLQLGERHEDLTLAVRHKVGKTQVRLELQGERTRNVDSRFVTNFPGEVIPWAIASLPTAAQPAAKATAPATSWNNQQAIVETEGIAVKSSGATLETDTPLTEKVTLRVNGNYELVHTAVSGSRPIVTQTPTAAGVVAVQTNNYADLAGGTRLKSLVGNVALDWKPTKALFVKLAYRAQEEYVRGSSTYTVVAASGTPATTLTSTPRLGWAKLEQDVRTPVVELRYTGIKDVAFYASGSLRDLRGIERNTSAYNPLTAALGTPAIQNVSEDHGNYTVGANWKVSPALTLRSEVFGKNHQDNTSGFESRIGDYYLLDSRYQGLKVTGLAHLSPQVGVTGRYVYQRGRMQVTGFLPTYPAYDSLRSENHLLAGTIDLTPARHWYVQLNGNVVFNVISTIYPRAGVTAATSTLAAFDTNRVLQNSDNNYVTAGILAGWTVDKVTDARLQWNSYRAANGNAVLAPMTLPYGVAVRDTSVVLALKRRLSARWTGHAKAGYFDSENDTTGGRTSYHGPVAYLAVEYGL